MASPSSSEGDTDSLLSAERDLFSSLNGYEEEDQQQVDPLSQYFVLVAYSCTCVVKLHGGNE